MWPFKKVETEPVVDEPTIDNEMFNKLNGILDKLIFNEKAIKYKNGYYYEDEIISFECKCYWSSPIMSDYIQINDNTACGCDCLVVFYSYHNPEWSIKSEVCRKRLLDHLQSIVDMASKLPSREEVFCKKLSAKNDNNL